MSRNNRYLQNENRFKTTLGNSENEGVLTVSDVVKYMTRSKNEWGISGYELPSFDVNFQKSIAVKISQNKKTSYLDELMKKSKLNPAPGQYKTELDGLMFKSKKCEFGKTKKYTLFHSV